MASKKRTAAPPPFVKAYSGARSADFWSRVNALKGPRQSAAYALGVALQDLEDSVLRQIEVFESETRGADEKGVPR